MCVARSSLQATIAPRVPVRCRSLRRVDKIAGNRAGGFPYKIVGEHVSGLSRKTSVEKRTEGFPDACRNCSCRKTYRWHLVWVERSRVVDGRDGDDGYDGVDGSSGCGGRDCFEGCGGLFESVEPIGAVRDG